MEATGKPKKRTADCEDPKSSGGNDARYFLDDGINQLTIKSHTYTRTELVKKTNLDVRKGLFHDWKFGTIIIRTGDEKSEGAKLYMITKEAARAGLKFCCMQEVRYRGTGRRVIRLNTGEK